jgi:aminoglycoside 6'-N-acetyltransferase I
MRWQLWPTGDHAAEIAVFFAGDRRDPAEVLVAEGADGRLLGFAEVTIRSHAEGCRPGRIAYLEGWFVEADVRRTGVGAALMAAVEDWGRREGCDELGSDTELANTDSGRAHERLGFEEACRIVCFRENLHNSSHDVAAADAEPGHRQV